jgi:hypothetical protein
LTESFAQYNVQIAKEKKEELKGRVTDIDNEMNRQNAIIDWQKKEIEKVTAEIAAAGGLDAITDKKLKAAIIKRSEDAQATLAKASEFVAAAVKKRENAVKVYKEEEERERVAQTYLSEAAEKRAVADEARFKKQLTADKTAFETAAVVYDALLAKAEDGTITSAEQTQLDAMEAGYFEAKEKYDQIIVQVKEIERKAGQKAFEKAAAQYEDSTRNLKLAEDKAKAIKAGAGKVDAEITKITADKTKY